MTCELVHKTIPLYFYGELTLEEEERVEDHLDGCSDCRREVERQRALSAALDGRQLAPPPGLLAECRHDLMRAVYREPAVAPRQARPSPWQLFREAFSSLSAPLARWRTPVGAVALVALGYFAARITTAPLGGPASTPSDVVYSAVRSVQPDDAGRVRIALDETRRRTVSGGLDDGEIQRLLMAAARDDSNPAVRVESVDVLRNFPSSEEIRAVLVHAVSADPSAAVRLKALDGLKPFAADTRVRKTLAQVLQRDENPSVRIKTIDMLIAQPDDSLVGVLQNLMQVESNSYVRLKCERALKDMNASVGIF